MTSFPDALKLFIINYFNFSGRASRAEYWWVQLALYIIYTVLYGVFFFTIPTSVITDSGSNAEGVTLSSFGLGGQLVIGILMFFSLAITIPSLSLLMRRLHDSDRSGFWILGSWFIPFLSIVVFVFTLMPSSVGSNTYGEPTGTFEITSSTPIPSYRPVLPAPVFEQSSNVPLDNGRFSVNRTHTPDIAPPPVPKLYKRSGTEADLPIAPVSFPGVPNLVSPVSIAEPSTGALEAHSEVAEEVEEEQVPQFSFASAPEEFVRPPDEVLPPLELIGTDDEATVTPEIPKPVNKSVNQPPTFTSGPNLSGNGGATPPPPPIFGNK